MRIPENLLPRDGRFGSGPSLVRHDGLERVFRSERMGTSHRQTPVRGLVASVRERVAALLGAPGGYEVMLGNGGATAFWDAAAFSLVRNRAAHGAFGEFSSKFARATDAAPFLEPSLVTRAEPGGCALPASDSRADIYAWPHNETSTGVIAPVRRIDDDGAALVVIDATSAAGGVEVDLAATDVYYFSPQKNLGSDGGLWIAVVSPRAVERIEEIAASGRWIPDFLALKPALDNSRKNQTLNTPAIATLELLDGHLGWLLDSGGLGWAAERTRTSSDQLYAWAGRRDFAAPFVQDRELRSPVVVTIDLEGVQADDVNAVLRSNGILDTFAYRKLGRNQLRVATFPAVDPADVAQLIRSIDYVVERI
ncbi:MAG TPA: phosphoserine transaminase [Actinomycetaceae bacterium]|nr:phosphoserine transaminase [Actinomycetaceae bacterium]